MRPHVASEGLTRASQGRAFGFLIGVSGLFGRCRWRRSGLLQIPFEATLARV